MRTINHSFNKTLLLIFISIFLNACAWTHKYEPKKLGYGVRTMVKSQIYDRSTINNPPLDVVEGMDSNKAISDLRKVYRKTIANKQKVKQSTLSTKQ